jgi:hypothetical protein
MKIDFSNPPASSKKVSNPVRAALNELNASRAKSTVSKATVSAALSGPTFKPAEKTVELYAPVRIKKPIAPIEPNANASAAFANASLKMANLQKLFMV